MKKYIWIPALLLLFIIAMNSVHAQNADTSTAYFPAEYAAEYEKAAATLYAHTPGAVIDYAVRERDDGRYEWDLFFTCNGQLGVAEVIEFDFSVRRVKLYDMSEETLSASQAVAMLAQQKGNVQIIDLELDWDDSRLQYEGEAMLNEKRYEFELSATGAIREWERD